MNSTISQIPLISAYLFAPNQTKKNERQGRDAIARAYERPTCASADSKKTFPAIPERAEAPELRGQRKEKAEDKEKKKSKKRKKDAKK